MSARSPTRRTTTPTEAAGRSPADVATAPRQLPRSPEVVAKSAEGAAAQERRDEAPSNGGNGHRPFDRHSGGQLVSYVEPTPKDPADRSAQQIRRNATGDAGVDLVVRELERVHGKRRRVRKMPDRQEGYDARVENPNGTRHQYIEVKTKTGTWDLRGVWLSGPQFRKAQTEAAKFTLAVVECVYEVEAMIHFVDDPARRVDRFCFDHGWGAAAQRSVNVLGAPPPDAATLVASAGNDLVATLTRAVLSDGLPEPETHWAVDDETELAVAWIDVRVGITASALPLPVMPNGWLVRPALEWTIEALVDAVRDDH